MCKIERDVLVTGVVILLIITVNIIIHTKSEGEKVEKPFPLTPCNETFNYEYDDHQIAFGRLHLENDMSGRYELIVKMAKAGGTDDEKLKIELDMENDQVERGDKMEYKVTFPQGEIPRLYYVNFNNKVDCIDKEPEPHEKSFNYTIFNAVLLQFARQKPIETSTSRGYDIPTLPGNIISSLVGGSIYQPQEDLKESSKNEECGIKFEFKRFGGGFLQYGFSQYNHPWLVAVLFPDADGKYVFHCAATLISNRHVITAAHCVEPIDLDKLLLVFGKRYFKFWDVDSLRNAKRIVVHPDYANQGDADVAIILINSQVTFNSLIKPICLWDEPNSLDDISGEMGTLFGWQRYSKDGDSRQMSIAIVRQSNCLSSNPALAYLKSNGTFCGGIVQVGGTPCTGDIGGGFIMKRNGRWRLRGVLSKVWPDLDQHSCSRTQYVVFVDVAVYGDWITSVLNDDYDDDEDDDYDYDDDDDEDDDDDDDKKEDNDDNEDDNDNDNVDELGNSTAATV